MPKKITYDRYAFQDILIQSNVENIGEVRVLNDRGEQIAETSAYFVTTEDEDGNEIFGEDYTK